VTVGQQAHQQFHFGAFHGKMVTVGVACVWQTLAMGELESHMGDQGLQVTGGQQKTRDGM
jgi:hypothetical protein